MCHEGPNNGARHFVLAREGVVQFPVVPLGPTMDARGGIDELRRDAEATTATPDASFQHVACAQLTPNLADIARRLSSRPQMSYAAAHKGRFRASQSRMPSSPSNRTSRRLGLHEEISWPPPSPAVLLNEVGFN
jgi:hypothetical protein